MFCGSLNYFSFLISRREAFCGGVYVAIANASGRVAIGFDGAITPLQVDVVEDNVSAGDSVAACKFHGIFAFRCTSYVAVHDLTDLDCCSLMMSKNEVC